MSLDVRAYAQPTAMASVPAPVAAVSLYNPWMVVDRPLLRIQPEERRTVTNAIRQALEHERDLLFVYLFGSFADGGPFHDIDVAVSIHLMSPAAAAQRAFDIAGRLERTVRFPIDVVALNGRPATFRFHAYRGELLVVNDEDRLVEELARTMAEYFDIEPILRHATREAFAG